MKAAHVTRLILQPAEGRNDTIWHRLGIRTANRHFGRRRDTRCSDPFHGRQVVL